MSTTTSWVKIEELFPVMLTPVDVGDLRERGGAAVPGAVVCGEGMARSEVAQAVGSGYVPMSLSRLAGYLASAESDQIRWKLVWEFLEEYRWEPPGSRTGLLMEEPEATGHKRWDALLAALAEHLLAQADLAPPEWAQERVLARPWFPADLAIHRADALAWAPAAFRKHGVYLSVHDLAAA